MVQGTEAGGHQASFLDRAPNLRPLWSLLEEVRDSIGVPLVGSGGIMTGGPGGRVLRRGAVAVQLGTVFLCSDEAGTSATYRRALLDRTYADTMLTRAFSGRYARGLANEFALTYSDAAPDAYPELHHLTRPLRGGGRAGDPSTPNLWAGQGWKSGHIGSGGGGRPSPRFRAGGGNRFMTSAPVTVVSPLSTMGLPLDDLPDDDGGLVEDVQRNGEGDHGERVGTGGDHPRHHDDQDDRPSSP